MAVSSLLVIFSSTLLLTILTLGWRILNWVWLRPKQLERQLREQGFSGNSYRLFFGDLKDNSITSKRASSKPINFSDDVTPRAIASVYHIVENYGKNCFVWVGPKPRLFISEPEQIKDIFSKIDEFQKSRHPVANLLSTGVVSYEGDKWAKHRNIITPAFGNQNLKGMTNAFQQCCSDMISQWEGLIGEKGSCELDIWPYIENLSADVISRTAFGSSYTEGKRIFQLQKEQAQLLIKAVSVHIPGWRFLPTKQNKRMKEIDREIRTLLKEIINKREREMKATGNAANDDFLGMLLESSSRELQESGNKKNAAMSITDVIEECKLFYIAGQETTADLVVWTMVLLSKYASWQVRAREEVLQVFGKNKPDFDGLNHLKVVNMILLEVLRFYPPLPLIDRAVNKETKLGNLTIPAGVVVTLPTILVHCDYELWGDNAKEFNPERFSEGVSKATRGKLSYFPFGGGPRICIGQKFGMMEAKMALSFILQHFSFEMSSSYAHAPITVITLAPQFGAHIVLHKL